MRVCTAATSLLACEGLERILRRTRQIFSCALARTHPGLLPALVGFADAGHPVLADLGYEGERTRLTCPHKVTRDRDLDVAERSFNRVHAYVRARAEQGNAWLKNYRVLQKVTLCPWRIGSITAAVLVVLHLEHDRTT